MLINQAKHLEQLPTSVLNDVERDYSQIQSLLKQANGITYNVQSMNQAYAQRYPVSISSATSDLQMIASAQQRWQDFASRLPAFADPRRRRGAKPAQHAGADELARLDASQSSVGVLQATQAGNQLVAVQTRQLADLTGLLAAQGRAQALEAPARRRPRARPRNSCAASSPMARAINPRPSKCSTTEADGGTAKMILRLGAAGLLGLALLAPPLPCTMTTSHNPSKCFPPSCQPIRSPPNSRAAGSLGPRPPAIPPVKRPGRKTAPGSFRPRTNPRSAEDGRQRRHRPIPQHFYHLYRFRLRAFGRRGQISLLDPDRDRHHPRGPLLGARRGRRRDCPAHQEDALYRLLCFPHRQFQQALRNHLQQLFEPWPESGRLRSVGQ